MHGRMRTAEGGDREARERRSYRMDIYWYRGTIFKRVDFGSSGYIRLFLIFKYLNSNILKKKNRM
jgi:hypothetical protein